MSDRRGDQIFKQTQVSRGSRRKRRVVFERHAIPVVRNLISGGSACNTVIVRNMRISRRSLRTHMH